MVQQIKYKKNEKECRIMFNIKLENILLIEKLSG